MTVQCGVHHGPVPETEAEIMDVADVGSGAGQPAYACIGCIRAEGIVPPRPAPSSGPTWVGHRDRAPGRPA